MRLKRLELYGFKSFPHRVEVAFPSGICAIVGPNGSGKSNIVDAVRWVLGEQSPRRLRARAMEDVIFSGSNGRGPNFAEVRLVLENNGQAPGELADLPEIVITRRLYRSGESEYLLNGRPCRLKDIHYLFMDTGAGHRAYAIIDQGEVGSFVELRPEERRLLIEEVAGVSRYKTRREEAQRRIKASQENLARLEDVLTEVKRQQNSLRRQAKKTERYLRLKEELQRLDIIYAAGRLQQTKQKTLALEKNLALLGEKTDLFSSKQQTLETEKARLILELSEKEEALSSLRHKEEACLEELSSQRRQLEKTRGEIKTIQTRLQSFDSRLRDIIRRQEGLTQKVQGLERNLKEAEETLDRLQKDEEELVSLLKAKEKKLEIHQALLAEKRQTYDSLGHQMAQLEAGQRRLLLEKERREKDLKRVQGQIAEISRRLEEANFRLTKAEKERDSVTENQQRILQKIEDLARRLETLSAQEKDLERTLSSLSREAMDIAAEIERLQRLEAKLAGLPPSARFLREKLGLPLVVEKIRPEPGWESALTALLSEALGFALVDDLKEAKEVLKALKEARLGPGGVLLEDKQSQASESVLAHGLPSALATMLAPFKTFDTAEEAFSGYDSLAARLLTKDGFVFWPGGMIKVLSSSEGQEILERRAKLDALAQRQKEIEVKSKTLRETLHNLRRSYQETSERLSKLKRQKKEGEERLLQISKEIDRTRARILGLEEQRKVFETQIKEVQLRWEEVKAELSELENNRREIQERIRHLGPQLKGLLSRERELSSVIKDLRSRLEKARLSRVRLEERRNQLLKEKARLDGAKRQYLREREELEARLCHQKPLLKELEVSLAKTEARVSDLETDYKHLKDQRESLEEGISGLKKRISEIEGDLKGLRLELRKLEDQRHRLDLEITECRLLAEHLKGKIKEKYQIDLETIDVAEGESLDEESFSRRVAEIKEELSRLGAINLAAVEEFKEVEKRLEFLLSQRSDLLKAIESLKEAISKINRLCREKIRQAVGQVNEKLKEVFPLLFEGGTAELRLVGSDDPLEAGLDLYIRLPGKRLQHLGLLSGGEKALSALAVVFAVFLIKPSPFCLLDEVDAPLDEANTLKFNRLIREIARQAQVIIITHNQRVMEVADTLYGITMEEQGISKIVSVKLAEAGQGGEQDA